MSKLISEDEFFHRASLVPFQRLLWPLAQQKGVDVWMRRDDCVDRDLSGNKFYKLFYHLQAAQSAGYKTILTFGGAYSNHIHALAAAGYRYGFNTIGVIRGERAAELSPTLKDAEAWGMQLVFMSRFDYGEKDTAHFQQELAKRYGDFFLVPEGGANYLGVKGAQVLGYSLGQVLKADYTAVCLACGTGNTLAGVAVGLADAEPNKNPTRAIGFSVLKGEGDLGRDIAHYYQSSLGRQPQSGDAKMRAENVADNWSLISGYHGGGYGKRLPLNLREFAAAFEQQTQILLDLIYTAKMCWGVAELLKQDYWPRGSRLVLIHTGGLQGRRGHSVTP